MPADSSDFDALYLGRTSGPGAGFNPHKQLSIKIRGFTGFGKTLVVEGYGL